jgi:hypothetical protein
MTDTFLSREDFATVESFITNELNTLGFKVSLSDWEKQPMIMADNLEFSDGTRKYQIYLSIRRPFSFGFGLVQKKPDWKDICCSKTLPFDGEYQDKIRTFLKEL